MSNVSESPLPEEQTPEIINENLASPLLSIPMDDLRVNIILGVVNYVNTNHNETKGKFDKYLEFNNARIERLQNQWLSVDRKLDETRSKTESLDLTE